MNAFTITLDQFKASLQNKNIAFKKKFEHLQTSRIKSSKALEK